MIGWREKLVVIITIGVILALALLLARCGVAAELPARCEQYRTGIEQAAVGRCEVFGPAEKGAQIMVESSCRDNARSSAGAVYAVQALPSTDRWLAGLDPAIRALPRGSRARGLMIQAVYLCMLHRDVGRHRPPSTADHCRLALAAYHSGPGGISSAARRAGASSWEAVRQRLGRYGRAYPDSVLGWVSAFRLSDWPGGAGCR